MVINKEILDKLSAQAKASPRLRMNLDLRNSPSDGSQRMLNALEPGTVMPVHRHLGSSETVICVRGHFEEYLYDSEGRLTATIDMRPGGNIVNVPAGQWHNLKCLESGTVLLEAKDGKWEPLGEGEVMEGKGGKDDFRSFALMFGLKILGQAGDEDGVRSGSSMMSWSVAALRASSCRRMGK